MDHRQQPVRNRDSNADAVDRRTLLARSVRALALSMFGGLAGNSAAQAQTPSPASPSPAAQPAEAVDRIRRVVSGLNPQNRSYVVSDEMVRPNDVWKTGGTEPLGAIRPDEQLAVMPSTRPQIDPAVGGSRFTIVAFQPSKDPKPNLTNRLGFHRTSTIDYCYLLSGEVVLLLDEQEVTIKAGDVVILRNSFHSWRNDGTVPARMTVTLVRVGS
jgi:naringenin degradation protein FdeH